MATTKDSPGDIDAQDDEGQTKIYLAAEAGNAAEVARLLTLKADFEQPSRDPPKFVFVVLLFN